MPAPPLDLPPLDPPPLDPRTRGSRGDARRRPAGCTSPCFRPPRGFGIMGLALLLLAAWTWTAAGQSLEGTATVDVAVRVPADGLWASLADHQTQLDAARLERADLRAQLQSLLAQAAPPLIQPEPAPIPDPPAPPTLLSGFTTPVRARDTRVVYVAADGNDRNHGRTPDAPMRTARAAYARLGDGRPDWLLFKAGDTFTDALGELTKSGRSAEEPFFIGVYGDGPRPVFEVQEQNWISSSFRNDLRYVVIQGLEAVAAPRDPGRADFDPARLAEHWSQGGISLLGDDADILIEDCVLRCFSVGIVLQSGNGHEPMRNVRLHRNIIVDSFNHHDKGAGGGHSQGLYAQEVDGLLIQENVFDRNGWCPQVPGAERTKFNHNLYIQTDCRNVGVVGNLITRGASHGLQLRPGGHVIDNVFARNALAFFVGWHHSTVTGNLVLETDDISDAETRGLGLEVMPAYHALVADNIFSTKRGHLGSAQAIHAKWDRAYLDRLAGAEFNLVLLNNKVRRWPTDDGQAIRIDPAWQVLANRGNAVDDPAWPDPSRDIAAYMVSLGLPGGFEGWTQQTRQRPRGQWNERFAAPALLQYVRAGFARP